MLLTLADLQSSIASVCVSPDGTRLAVVNEGDEGEVLIAELPFGQPVAHFTGLGFRPHVAFRSQTELIITHGEECLHCDLTDKSHRTLDVSALRQTYSELSCCRLSPDGRFVAVGGKRSTAPLLLDLAGANEPRLLGRGGNGFTEGINYSPDGCRLAVVLITEDGDRWCRVIEILDTRTGESIRDLKLSWIDGYVYATGFHPDNRTLAVGWYSNVLLFDLHPPPSPLDPEILFGTDLSGYSMGWGRPTACRPLGSQDKDWLGPAVLTFSADGRVLRVLCGDGEAVLMSTADGRILQRTLPPADSGSNLFGADISPGGRAAVRADTRTVLLWEVPGWEEGKTGTGKRQPGHRRTKKRTPE
jgi:WD40 repeat protein